MANDLECRRRRYVTHIIRNMGVRENTFYLLKKKYGELGTLEIRELRQHREEKTKLRQLVADLSLDRQMLQKIVTKNGKVGATARSRCCTGDWFRVIRLTLAYL